MAALPARLFIFTESSADKKIIAYNFDDAVWEEIYVTGNTALSGSGVAWDGAYHIWWRHDNDYYKRLDLYNLSVSSFLSAEPFTALQHNYYCHNYDGFIYGFADNAAGYLKKFDHATGLWSVEANPGADGVGIVVPMSAVERPGKVFWGQHEAQTFKEFDPIVGTWANKLNAPGDLEAGDIVWADEYVFMNQNTDVGFYKYNVNANTWASMAVRDRNAGNDGQQLAWDYNDVGYIYWLCILNHTLYRYDIVGDAWISFATIVPGVIARASICYVPRIRYLYLNSSGNVVTNPMNLGCEFTGSTGAGTLYYVKALEAVGVTTLAIENDPRDDADELLDIAADNAGVPGAWGASVNLGAMAANATVPFWIRIDAAAAPSTQPRSARLTLATP